MCASEGLKCIRKYDFAETTYLLLSFVRGATETGRLMQQAIVNHPEDSFQLHGRIWGLAMTYRNNCQLLSEGKTWRAIAAIFYEQYDERSGHYWAYCRSTTDKNWYAYNDASTGDKLKKLPEGLPNIYATIYQQCDAAEIDTAELCRGDCRDMDWEYIRKIVALEAESTPPTTLNGRKHYKGIVQRYV